MKRGWGSCTSVTCDCGQLIVFLHARPKRRKNDKGRFFLKCSKCGKAFMTIIGRDINDTWLAYGAKLLRADVGTKLLHAAFPEELFNVDASIYLFGGKGRSEEDEEE